MKKRGNIEEDEPAMSYKQAQQHRQQKINVYFAIIDEKIIFSKWALQKIYYSLLYTEQE